MVKLIQGLEKKRGIAIWIYDSEDDLPKSAKGYERMVIEGEIRYHSPSAIEFWDYNFSRKGEWETIVTDKRKNKINPKK